MADLGGLTEMEWLEQEQENEMIRLAMERSINELHHSDSSNNNHHQSVQCTQTDLASHRHSTRHDSGPDLHHRSLPAINQSDSYLNSDEARRDTGGHASFQSKEYSRQDYGQPHPNQWKKKCHDGERFDPRQDSATNLDSHQRPRDFSNPEAGYGRRGVGSASYLGRTHSSDSSPNVDRNENRHEEYGRGSSFRHLAETTEVIVDNPPLPSDRSPTVDRSANRQEYGRAVSFRDMEETTEAILGSPRYSTSRLLNVDRTISRREFDRAESFRDMEETTEVIVDSPHQIFDRSPDKRRPVQHQQHPTGYRSSSPILRMPRLNHSLAKSAVLQTARQRLSEEEVDLVDHALRLGGPSGHSGQNNQHDDQYDNHHEHHHEQSSSQRLDNTATIAEQRQLEEALKASREIDNHNLAPPELTAQVTMDLLERIQASKHLSRQELDEIERALLGNSSRQGSSRDEEQQYPSQHEREYYRDVQHIQPARQAWKPTAVPPQGHNLASSKSSRKYSGDSLSIAKSEIQRILSPNQLPREKYTPPPTYADNGARGSIFRQNDNLASRTDRDIWNGNVNRASVPLQSGKEEYCRTSARQLRRDSSHREPSITRDYTERPRAVENQRQYEGNGEDWRKSGQAQQQCEVPGHVEVEDDDERGAWVSSDETVSSLGESSHHAMVTGRPEAPLRTSENFERALHEHNDWRRSNPVPVQPPLHQEQSHTTHSGNSDSHVLRNPSVHMEEKETAHGSDRGGLVNRRLYPTELDLEGDLHDGFHEGVDCLREGEDIQTIDDEAGDDRFEADLKRALLESIQMQPNGIIDSDFVREGMCESEAGVSGSALSQEQLHHIHRAPSAPDTKHNAPLRDGSDLSGIGVTGDAAVDRALEEAKDENERQSILLAHMLQEQEVQRNAGAARDGDSLQPEEVIITSPNYNVGVRVPPQQRSRRHQSEETFTWRRSSQMVPIKEQQLMESSNDDSLPGVPSPSNLTRLMSNRQLMEDSFASLPPQQLTPRQAGAIHSTSPLRERNPREDSYNMNSHSDVGESHSSRLSSRSPLPAVMTGSDNSNRLAHQETAGVDHARRRGVGSASEEDHESSNRSSNLNEALSPKAERKLRRDGSNMLGSVAKLGKKKVGSLMKTMQRSSLRMTSIPASATNGPADPFERAMANEALDAETLLQVERAVVKGIITNLNGAVNIGNESTLFHADAGPASSGMDVAVKMYKRARGLGNTNPSQSRNVGSPEQLTMWTVKEYRNLKNAIKAGVPAPRALMTRQNILFMQFLGEDGQPSPRLGQLELRRGHKRWKALYKQIMNALGRLYNGAHLVHGSLNESNILVVPKHVFDPTLLRSSKEYGMDQAVLIDFGQTVDSKHPDALDLLRRDLQSIRSFFIKQGIRTPSVDEAMQFVTMGSATAAAAAAAAASKADTSKPDEAHKPPANK